MTRLKVNIARPCWMYHADYPVGRVFDEADYLAMAKLREDGWVDSPAKINQFHYKPRIETLQATEHEEQPEPKVVEDTTRKENQHERLDRVNKRTEVLLNAFRNAEAMDKESLLDLAGLLNIENLDRRFSERRIIEAITSHLLE